jgi:flagellar basal-body rod protein FlgG
MDLALLIARSGLDAHHKSIEVISNNLANANTPGFKKNRAEFEELPYQVSKQPGSPAADGVTNPGGVVIGTGAKMGNNKKIFTDGAPVSTGGALDVAITGRGFFQVQPPNGGELAYTRSGNLTLNEQGQLTMPNGYLVQPPITIPAGTQSIGISEDGIVSIVGATGGTQQQIGQLQLADFINPDGLLPIGQNLYQPTTASGQPTLGNPSQQGMGSLAQGSIEGSNVNVVEEMVNLIEAQRAFEVTSKAVSAVDNMLQYLNQAT